MMIDPFQPAAAGSTTCSVGVADAFFAIPGNGECLELNNLGTATIFVETDGVTISTVANSYPIQPGHCKIVKRLPNPGTPGIRAISTVAAQSLIVSVGNGI